MCIAYNALSKAARIAAFPDGSTSLVRLFGDYLKKLEGERWPPHVKTKAESESYEVLDSYEYPYDDDDRSGVWSQFVEYVNGYKAYLDDEHADMKIDGEGSHEDE